MARHWERFTGGPHISSRDRLHVTLNSRGMIKFNRKAYEALGKPAAAVLFFEKASSLIGIGPAQPHLTEAFPFIQNNMNWTLNAMPFCRHFGIKFDTGTEAFVDPEFDTDGTLMLNLRQTRRVYGGRGKKNRKPTEGS
jgi:hypothetical protein